MRAIIDATGYQPGIASLLYYKPTPLLCVGGKPIVIHVLEFLGQQGVTDVDIILNYLPEKIEKELGTGRRWGINITYHLARNAEFPFQAIQPFAHKLRDKSVLFALADNLPAIDPLDIIGSVTNKPVMFMFPDNVWSGWGFIPVSFLEKVSHHLNFDDLLSQLEGKYEVKIVEHFLNTRKLKEFKLSNLRFLNDEHALSVFPTSAKHVEDGVWISRGVSLHPTAKIIPPVFIGEYCQINNETTIGPNTVIEDFCIIDEESDVADSIVCKGSYVGEGLTINNCIVDRNLLLNLSLDTSVSLCDDFILGESNPRPSFAAPFRLLERIGAAALFILFYPIYFLMFYNHHLRKKAMLKLPASNDTLLWETIKWETFELNAGREPTAFHRIFFRLPLLKGIVRGDIHFVGVIPRTPKDVEELPPDWKKLYLRSKIGIITVSDIEEREDEDTLYASEVLYVTQQSLCYDVKLFLRWFLKKCKKIMS